MQPPAMTPPTTATNTAPTAEQISSAQTRLQQLKESQIRAQAELDAAEAELANLMSSIQQEYNVRTVEELEALLASYEEQNAKAAGNFVNAVAEIDMKLNQLQA